MVECLPDGSAFIKPTACVQPVSTITGFVGLYV